MRNAISGSGITSATTDFTPSVVSAASRCMPFGEMKPSPSATAITGSRNRPTFGITEASRSACAFDSSRWYGVGLTLSIGSAASATQNPPSGSRYETSTWPPASSICPSSFVISADFAPLDISSTVRPTEPASAFTFFLRGVAAAFFSLGGFFSVFAFAMRELYQLRFTRNGRDVVSEVIDQSSLAREHPSGRERSFRSGGVPGRDREGRAVRGRARGKGPRRPPARHPQQDPDHGEGDRRGPTLARRPARFASARTRSICCTRIARACRHSTRRSRTRARLPS